jgi:hypothetical protein
MPKREKKQPMSKTEVLAELKITERSLFRKIKAGKINPHPKAPGAEIRHRLVFDRAEVERYIKDNS